MNFFFNLHYRGIQLLDELGTLTPSFQAVFINTEFGIRVPCLLVMEQRLCLGQNTPVSRALNRTCWHVLCTMHEHLQSQELQLASESLQVWAWCHARARCSGARHSQKEKPRHLRNVSDQSNIHKAYHLNSHFIQHTYLGFMWIYSTQLQRERFFGILSNTFRSQVTEISVKFSLFFLQAFKCLNILTRDLK